VTIIITQDEEASCSENEQQQAKENWEEKTIHGIEIKTNFIFQGFLLLLTSSFSLL